jgi:hypothetical protein
MNELGEEFEKNRRGGEYQICEGGRAILEPGLRLGTEPVEVKQKKQDRTIANNSLANEAVGRKATLTKETHNTNWPNNAGGTVLDMDAKLTPISEEREIYGFVEFGKAVKPLIGNGGER